MCQAVHSYDAARQASLLVLHRPTPLSRQKAHTWSTRSVPDLPFALWRLARDHQGIQVRLSNAHSFSEHPAIPSTSSDVRLLIDCAHFEHFIVIPFLTCYS